MFVENKGNKLLQSIVKSKRIKLRVHFGSVYFNKKIDIFFNQKKIFLLKLFIPTSTQKFFKKKLFLTFK